LNDQSAGFDAQESVLGRSGVEAGGLGVGKESVRPPDTSQHLITDAEFIIAVIEPQSLVVPVLAEVEINCEILVRISVSPTSSASSYRILCSLS